MRAYYRYTVNSDSFWFKSKDGSRCTSSDKFFSKQRAIRSAKNLMIKNGFTSVTILKCKRVKGLFWEQELIYTSFLTQKESTSNGRK